MDELTPEQRKEIDDPGRPMFAYFQPTVLAQYIAEGHKFLVKLSDFEGEISINPAYFKELGAEVRKKEGISLKFGFRKTTSGEYCLAVFAYQFGLYTMGHVDRWRPHVVSSSELAHLPDIRFEMWVARYVYGSWEIENNVIQRIDALISLINAVTIEAYGASLFEWSSNPHLHSPLAENNHAYQDSHKELYRYLIDGLRSKTVDQILQTTGAAATGSTKQTRNRLESALPGLANSKLWPAFSKMSNQRGEATHKVRKPSIKFPAFETFVTDLHDCEEGLKELKSELESVLGIDGEKAMSRQESKKHLQRIDRPMQNSLGATAMNQMVGRTVERIEMGLRENFEDVHSSDVILIYFTDGSILGIDVHSNAYDVSSAHGDFSPSEFDTNIFARFVQPPQQY